jgi:uncharacterized integral membrane protein (TIGR00698 family)
MPKTANMLAALNGVWPGLAASVLIAGAAGLVASWTNGPIMLFALLFGVALNFLGRIERLDAGISFTSKFVLRLGVALLGLKITFGDFASLGWEPLLLVVAATALTILAAIAVARWMGFDPRFGLLSGGATAICGASAAMALSAALPSHPMKERATLYTVVGVSVLSTAAMVLYPVIARLLGFDDEQAGIFIGAAIHDVAQVVGAGYAVSPDAGDTAMIVKLARVAMLLPVILAIGIFMRSADASADERPPLLPWFATAFGVLVLLQAIVQVDHRILNIGSHASRFCLVASIAALGLKTRFKDIFDAGWRPVVLMLLETAFIAALAIIALKAGWV